MNGLDLFSGIGGNSIALRDYVETVAYCESDRHAQSVLLSRMGDGELRPAPIWDDISTLEKSRFNIPIDIIIAGFPCQDISCAGRGKGLAGKRSGLYWEVHRLVKELSPAFVFLENVPAIRTRGLREIIRSLTNVGYDCRWTCVSAAEVGALHIRKRWFLLAHTNGQRVWHQQGWSCWEDWESAFVSINNGKAGWWPAEPGVGRVANGISLRVDRIKRLGNAVVPLQAKVALERLLGL